MPRDPGLFLARRLGLGLRIGEDSPPDARVWAMDQLRQVPPLDFIGPDGGSLRSRLPEYAEPLVDFEQACRVWEVYKVANTKLQKQSGKLSSREFDQRMWEEIVLPYLQIPRWRDCLTKTLTAVNGDSPVFERFWMFWNNHFTVATPEAEIKLFYGPHIRNIRRRMTGKFEDLLFDAIANPAMLAYLNNDTSAGPNSRAARNEKHVDLNENLARELLELHTMSPAAGYSQKDVVETALLLTGWQFYAGAITNGGKPQKGQAYGTRYNSYRHEPGKRTILGKTYRPKGNGENMLHELVRDLAAHAATRQFISWKLCRHFIADDPPEESVAQVAAAWAESDGDLIAIHSAVIDETIAKAPGTTKMTTPENWLLQAFRTVRGRVPMAVPGGGEAIHWLFKEIGQAFDECPQPNGWPDTSADWLSRTMLDRRIRQADRIATTVDTLTADEIGDHAERLVGSESRLPQTLRRAESRQMAVALLLTAPQFLKM